MDIYTVQTRKYPPLPEYSSNTKTNITSDAADKNIHSQSPVHDGGKIAKFRIILTSGTYDCLRIEWFSLETNNTIFRAYDHITGQTTHIPRLTDRSRIQ